MKSIFFKTSLFFFSFSLVSAQILGGQIKSKNICGAYNQARVFLVFACHNLGADTTLNPFSYQNGAINGDLYQWGRFTDGHEKRNSVTINTLATNNDASLPIQVKGKFIYIDINNKDWISSPNNALWGDGTSGSNPNKAVNDPCPQGFKVPSISQWRSIFSDNSGPPSSTSRNTWIWTGNGYTVGSSLYLPCAGIRNSNIFRETDEGNYWSSTPSGLLTSYSYVMYFTIDNIYVTTLGERRNGMSIRCIAE